MLILSGTHTLQVADRFEVAAIHRNRGQNRDGDLNTQISLPEGGRLVVGNATLKTLTRNAWGLLAFQVAAGPARFDNGCSITAGSITTGSISPQRPALRTESHPRV